VIHTLPDTRYDLAVIGGGPAGMAAALRASELGVKKIIILERNPYLGGILPQCIHNGFGLKFFKKDLTGPQYSQVFIDRLKDTDVEVLLCCTALSLAKSRQKVEILAASSLEGVLKIEAKSAVLALGCRERTRGQVSIHGTRPAGVYTAGFIQKLVNIEGYLPGREAVILGSGDIGLIMARRLRLEGVDVKGVYELMPFSTGLTRNIYQCLKDYGIGLHLGQTVTRIFGHKRLEAVEVAKLDEGLMPLKDSARIVRCDCLLLSVGLIPENELSRTCGIVIDENTQGPLVNEFLHTSVEGIFSCGNSLFVNDIVDSVTEDGFIAAESAAGYLEGKKGLGFELSQTAIRSGANVAYISPQRVSLKSKVHFKIRARTPMRDAEIHIEGTGFKRSIRHVLPGELIGIRLDIPRLMGKGSFFKKPSEIRVSIIDKDGRGKTG
jgi:NADPH-dependent 2,4-dienoyl-CoA reductase/sulfur reductase-like enzyme